MPLISLDHVTTALGHVPLLDHAAMQVKPGERIASSRNSTTVDMKVLNRFGEASGGRAWEIAEASFGRNMDAVLDTIARELRSQYSIGYYPNRPKKDGKWHSVHIRMKHPDYVARGRKEYLDK